MMAIVILYQHVIIPTYVKVIHLTGQESGDVNTVAIFFTPCCQIMCFNSHCTCPKDAGDEGSLHLFTASSRTLENCCLG